MSLPSDWSYKRLEDVVSRKRYGMVDGPFGSNLKSEHYKSEGIPVLQSGFVTSGKFKVDKYVYVEQKLFEEQKRSSAKGGDILMAKIGAQAGRCAIIPYGHREAIIAGNCLKLSFDDNDTEFFSYVLAFEYEKNGLSEIKTETAQPAISLKSLKAYKVPVPPLPEQKKIAQILSTWDQAISTTEQLLANSQQQKKALMQQLLTGKKRLLDKNGVRFSGEWKKHHFSDLVSLGKEKFDPKTSDFVSECVELEHISQATAQLDGSTNTINSVSTKTVFEANDILFGKLRPYLRKYWLADRKGVCSTEIWVFKAKKQLIAQYLFQLVQLDSFIDAANKSSGTHMPRADWNIIKDFMVPVPTLDEQNKIADVLSTADQGIATLQRKLDCLKQEKKALMQQLLTGKRRVILD